VPDVRRAVTEVDADLPIDRVTILSEQVRRGLNQERLVAGLTSVFGMLALGLACFGLFGVLSYVVAQRTNEIGIRLALGAECWRGGAWCWEMRSGSWPEGWHLACRWPWQPRLRCYEDIRIDFYECLRK
jgi:hypothetical protein